MAKTVVVRLTERQARALSAAANFTLAGEMEVEEDRPALERAHERLSYALAAPAVAATRLEEDHGLLLEWAESACAALRALTDYYEGDLDGPDYRPRRGRSDDDKELAAQMLEDRHEAIKRARALREDDRLPWVGR